MGVESKYQYHVLNCAEVQLNCSRKIATLILV